MELLRKVSEFCKSTKDRLHIYKMYVRSVVEHIPPIWFGLAFLRTRLPCSDPTTDDKNSRVELAEGTKKLESLVVSSMNTVKLLAEAATQLSE